MPESAAVKTESQHGPATVLSSTSGERLSFLGSHIRLILTGAETGGAYSLVEQTDGPGVGIPGHYHTREDEIFHVMEGQMKFTSDGEVYFAGPGTTVNLPRGTQHSFEITEKARFLLTIVPAGMEHMFHELSQLPPEPPDMAAVARICGNYGIFFVE